MKKYLKTGWKSYMNKGWCMSRVCHHGKQKTGNIDNSLERRNFWAQCSEVLSDVCMVCYFQVCAKHDCGECGCEKSQHLCDSFVLLFAESIWPKSLWEESKVLPSITSCHLQKGRLLLGKKSYLHHLYPFPSLIAPC